MTFYFPTYKYYMSIIVIFWSYNYIYMTLPSKQDVCKYISTCNSYHSCQSSHSTWLNILVQTYNKRLKLMDKAANDSPPALVCTFVCMCASRMPFWYSYHNSDFLIKLNQIHRSKPEGEGCHCCRKFLLAIVIDFAHSMRSIAVTF